MRVYLAIKFHEDCSNRERIAAISSVLTRVGYETFCVARDLEWWGEVRFSPDVLMQKSFAAIDTSDVVLVELTEKGVGVGIEAGYAFARGIPVFTVAEAGADISETLRGISKATCSYTMYDELTNFLKQTVCTHRHHSSSLHAEQGQDMNTVAIAYEQLIDRFIQWAQTEDNIRAALVIGSRARTNHPADEWSDLDVIILANDPEPYWATTDWLHHVGVPWLTFVEPLPMGNGFERRVLFEGGLDVDFVPDQVAPFRQMLDEGHLSGLADLIHRGIRFLVDKEGFAERLARIPVALPPYQPPTESEFLNLVHDFWYHTVWTAKKLRRGELWTAKSCCDSYLKQLLRQMLEWHTRARQGTSVDTWMRGRFLEEWVDARAVAALPGIFAHYDEPDVWRALLATMELFQWLAVETVESLGYAYPASGEARATEVVQRLFNR